MCCNRLIPAGRRAWLWALFPILLAAALPSHADAIPSNTFVTDVEVAPFLPSYLDSVTVTVSGVSDCAVSPEEVKPTTSGFLLTVNRVCTLAPPQAIPFAITFDLPRRPPGIFELQVEDEALGILFEDSYRVYQPGLFVIETPGEPATDDSPVTLRITGYGPYCPEVVETEVADGVIDILLDLHCAIGTPPLVLFTLDHEVGPLPAGDYQVGVTERVVGDPGRASRGRLTVYRADGCIPSATELCLNDDRFRLAVTWRDFEGGEGEGFAVPLAGGDDTGMFWFFNQDNVELTVKVLNGCGVNGHYWVFVASGSTVEYEITVTDTAAEEGPGRVRTYRNALRQTPALIPDTQAFPNCD